MTSSSLEKLQDTLEEDFVTKLVRINFKYLDRYLQDTQDQANRSLWVSGALLLVGLAAIGLGISMMSGIAEGSPPDGLAAPADFLPAYVTIAAGVAVAIIAAIFFQLYNQTVSKMSDYHDRLAVTQNVSLALKIVEELEGDAKAEAHKQLIDRLTKDVNL